MSAKPLPLFETLAAVFGVALIAFLAALPALKDGEADGRAVVLADQLEQVRTAVDRLAREEGGVPATGAALEEALLARHLTAMPVNPYNQQSAIRVSSAAFTEARPNGSAGWLYVPATRTVVPDLPGQDASGRSFISY